MTDNQFDEFFRKKLGNYSSKVPEDMWQRIKKKKDKDRKVFILLLLLLLIVGGSGSYFVFRSKENTNKENIASSQKHINNENENTSLTKNKANETINTQHDTIKLQQENKNLSNNEVNRKNAVERKDIVNSDKLNYTTDKNNKLVLNESVKEKNINNTIENNNKGQAKLSEQNPSKNTLDSLTSNFLNQNPIKPEENIPVKQNNQKSLLQKDSSSAKDEKNINSTIKINKPVINNLSFEIYLSPDIPFSKTSSANNTYLQHKDSTSKMEVSYTVGVKLSALFGNHILGKIGFQYSQINEKFNYTNKHATRTVPVVIERSLADAYGIMRTVLDTSNFVQTGTQYTRNYNHYKSIDIPVTIGYETNGDRFKAAFNTGIILNIKTSYSGNILDPSLNSVDLSSDKIYKSNTGVSLYFGLGLLTRLDNSLQLFTEPYIRYRLNNMAATHQPFTQKINVGGLSFGLKYNFKK